MSSRTAKRERRGARPAVRRSLPEVTAAGSSAWRWLIPLLLIVVTVITFLPVCGSDFTTWDDYPNVAKNPRLNPVTMDGVLYFWARPYMSIYIPITYTVWGALAALARMPTPDASGVWLNPWLFHTANLAVHVIAVLLAYGLLASLLGHARWAAALGALLFAIHPVQVEPVAWVAGMKDVLCGALSLAALWHYALFARPMPGDGRAGEGGRHRRWHYAAATLAFVLAVLAKPSGMMVPLAALVIDRLLLRGLPWRRSLAALLPWFALSLACAIAAKVFQPVATLPDAGHVWARPFLAGAALAFYLWKLVWPAGLTVQYHYSPEVLFRGGAWVWVAWVVPAIVATLLWLFGRRRPWLLAAGALFVVPTLPVLGLVPFQFERLSLTADHYLYLAMIGPALGLSFALASLHRPRARQVAIGVCAAALGGLAVRSYCQAMHWHDTETLFEHARAVNPSSEVAYNGLAARAGAAHDAARAEAYARESLRLQPNQEEAHITLGAALARQHRRDEAISQYAQACAINPENPVALNDLAGMLADAGRIDQAMPLCLKALQLDPLSAAAHRNLSVMLVRKRQMPEALREARTAVQLDPADAEGQINLAVLLATTGQPAAALEHLHQALRVDPNNAKARDVMQFLEQHGR